MGSQALASGASTFALWAQNSAINAGTFATKGHSMATWASNAATWARGTATWAANFAQTKLTFSTIAGTGAAWAGATATWAKNAAQTASAFAANTAAVAQGRYATSAWGAAAANGSLVASFAPFLVTVGAAAAAVGALAVAWKQWEGLNAETGGLGITGLVGEMAKRGTLNPFEALDAHQNEKARAAAAAEQPQLASGGGRVDRSESVERVELVLPPGAKPRDPRAKGSALKLAPSGEF
jgi:hypothetical protein